MTIQYALDFTHTAAPITPQLKIAFRSGMSRSKDFWAAAAVGVPIGVVATELTLSLALSGMRRHLATGAHVFIDSGAFAELATGEVPDFDRVLRVYESIADPFLAGFNPSQLYLVAPDKVGDQLATLERLAKYASRVHALIRMGCKVIVPLQRGVIPAAEMLARAIKILGTNQFVAGIPSNKEALSIAECSSLNHHAYHILGRVQMNRDQLDRLSALAGDNSDVEITADANWLRSRLNVVTALAQSEHMDRIAAPVSEYARMLRSSPRAIAITTALRQESTWGLVA